jgi:hypothetical protein
MCGANVTQNRTHVRCRHAAQSRAALLDSVVVLGGVQTTALAAVSPTMDEIKVWERNPFPVALLFLNFLHTVGSNNIAGN